MHRKTNVLGVLLLLAMYSTVFADEATTVTTAQVTYQVADSAEVVPIKEGPVDRVRIISTNLDSDTQYGVMVRVENQVNDYIAVYKIIDKERNLVSFPPEYIQSEESKPNEYLISGNPGDSFWVEVRSQGPPIVIPVSIEEREGPTDPPNPPDPGGDFSELETQVKQLADAMNEPDVRTALLTAFKTYSPADTLDDSIYKFTKLQEDTFRTLGSTGALNKNWFDGFVVPLDQTLAELMSAGKIDTTSDFVKVVNAMVVGLSPSTSSSSSVTSGPTKASSSYITMYTRPNCPECDRWKTSILPSLLSLGWSYKEVKGSDHPYSSPSFVVCEKGRCSDMVTGFMTIPKFTEVVTNLRKN